MAYLNYEQLEKIGFKSLGKNVLISDKASIYNANLIDVGDNSRIDDFCVISGKVWIGRNIHITIFSNIAGGSEGVYIGDFSTLAYGCNVFSQSDDYSGATMTNSTIPSQYKCEIKKSVHIGRHCILGTNTIVFPGVVLAEGTSVGAMSLIRESTEAWSIYVGNPARRVKSRKRDLLELEKQFLKYEDKNKIL